MALYGDNFSDMNFYFILEKVEAEKPHGVFSLSRDSEVDSPESNSQTHFKFIKNGIILKTFQ